MPAFHPLRRGSNLIAAWGLSLLVAAASAGILFAATADAPDLSSVEQALKLR